MLAVTFETVYSVFTLVVAVAAVSWVAFLMPRGDSGDREREEEARRFFDEHGHWPGEDSGTSSNGSVNDRDRSASM